MVSAHCRNSIVILFSCAVMFYCGGGGGDGGGGSAPSGSGAISTAPGGEPPTGAPVSEPVFEPPASPPPEEPLSTTAAPPPPSDQPVTQEPVVAPAPTPSSPVVAAGPCMPLKTEESYMSFPDVSSGIKTISQIGESDVFMVAHYNKIFLWDTDPALGINGFHQGWLMPTHPKTGSAIASSLNKRSYCFQGMSVVVAGVAFEINHEVCAISASYVGSGNRYLLFDMGAGKGFWEPRWLGGIENMDPLSHLLRFDPQKIKGQNSEPPYITEVDVLSPREPTFDYWLMAQPKKPSAGYDALGDGYKMEKHEPLVIDDKSYRGAGGVSMIPYLQDGKVHIWRLYQLEPLGYAKTYRLAFIQSETNARVVSEEFTTGDYIERIFWDGKKLYALARSEIVPLDLFWDEVAKTYRIVKGSPLPIGKNEPDHKIRYSAFVENQDFSNRTTIVGKYLFTFASVYQWLSWSTSLMAINLQTGEQAEVLTKIKSLYDYGVEKFHFSAGQRNGMEGIVVWQDNDLKLYKYESALCP